MDNKRITFFSVLSMMYKSSTQLNLATKITLLRIILIPFILLLMLVGYWETDVLATGLFIVAALSDFVDGKVARYSNEVTPLGTVLDHVCDKILVYSVMGMLLSLDRLDIWPFLLVIARDTFVAALRDIYAQHGIVKGSGVSGKIKTSLQMTALMLLIYYGRVNFGIAGLTLYVHEVGTFLLWVSVIMSWISLYFYLLEFIDTMNIMETPIIYVSTTNNHKILEMESALHKKYKLESVYRYVNSAPPEENGNSFEENARIKSIDLSLKMPNKIVIADDSGIVVDALNGAPGIYSSRYAGEDASDQDNINKLLEAMSGIFDRSAKMVCVISVALNGRELGSFRGEWAGSVADHQRGQFGFGYDPVFVDSVSNKTAAELVGSEKYKISHRAKALSQLADFLDHIKADA